MSDRCASSCRGKIRYTSPRKAAAAAKESQIKFGVPLNPYFCDYCRHYHVGNTFARNGKRARDKEESPEL
jgi:hypothetical protein